MDISEYIEFSEKMRAYDYFYYRGTPIISNEEYDGLFERLKFLEEKYHIPDYMRASERIGLSVIGEKISHLFKMYSMDKVYSIPELLDRVNRFSLFTKYVLIEYKYDGIAVEVRYRGGKPYQVVSRGNGDFGVDITYNFFSYLHPENLPSIPIQEEAVIIGEVVMPQEAYAVYGDGVNLCAIVSGLMMGQKPSDNWHAPDFVAYDIRPKSGDLGACLGRPILLHSEIEKALFSWGFITPKPLKVEFTDIQKTVERMEKERHQFLYPTDGICVKVDQLAQQQELGYTQKAPRFHLAYKWNAPHQDSVIRSISFQTGVKGRVTPVATIDPVYFNNKEFTKVNLHVFDRITRENLKVGDTIRMIIRGGLIPKFEKITKRTGTEEIQFPTQCPSCQSLLKNIGKYWVCENPNCPAKK